MHHVNDWMPTLLSAAAAATAGDPRAKHKLRLGAGEPPFLMGDGIDSKCSRSLCAFFRRSSLKKAAAQT